MFTMLLCFYFDGFSLFIKNPKFEIKAWFSSVYSSFNIL